MRKEHNHNNHHNGHCHNHSACKSKNKSQKKILIAFILNLSFSIFELVGGFFSGSVAITSDAVHDFGDAASIGASYFLEKKSKKAPDDTYTYGYMRFSVLGAFITNNVLLVGSVSVIWASVLRLLNPSPINYNAMIIFAVVGFLVNLLATVITSKGDSLNERSINLHMLEDVLGWVVVLIGSLVMRFTDIYYIDSIMSIGVSLYMLWHVIKNMIEIGRLFLVKIPREISVDTVKEKLLQIEGVEGVHHIHLWSMSEGSIYCTLHLVTQEDSKSVKEQARQRLKDLGVFHVTLELESLDESCAEESCTPIYANVGHGHHHHH